MCSWLETDQTRLVILPPKFHSIPNSFRRVELDPERYEFLIDEMQRFRGSVYRNAGYMQQSELTPDGRHRLEIDNTGWHLLTIDGADKILGCARCLVHDSPAFFNNLCFRNTSAIRCPQWGRAVRAAIERDLEQVQKRGARFAEVGGWAISERRRGTGDAMRIALAVYSLALALGAGVAITWASVTYGSAAILRRIGGQPITPDGVELAPYYDPQYRCWAEMLRFDSRSVGEKYRDWIDDFRQRLCNLPVVGTHCAPTLWPMPAELAVKTSSPW
jgi:hypothetical protein